jgi:DNA-3-methyladenine glycosylase I
MTAAEPTRCTWAGIDEPIYTHYHDTEWGVPKVTDRELFEKLILEGFQAGLSWLTILKKREAFRQAFDQFEPEKIARYTEVDRARLMANAGIIRNRLKIDATIDNARAYLAFVDKQRSLATFLWDFLDGRPQINTYKKHGDVPAETELSKRMSKALKAEGFRFVGPTTMYAFMQASGMVNDHLVSCHRHGACSALMKKFKAPSHGQS